MTNVPTTSGGAGVMVLEAKLNNIAQNNSSPRFTTLPTPFYCANMPQQYNLGASDANSDSLSFALTPGLLPGGTAISYVSPFSATNPLWVNPGTFSFSSSTGQMNFSLAGIQWSLVVQTVEEYHNGVLVGTASREMTFIALTNCNTNPANNTIDTSAAANPNNSSVFLNTTSINVCQGADSAYLKIVANNPANNIIKATVTGLPAGASAVISNDSSTAPLVTFIWKNPMVPPGSYTFYVTYKDDGCPITSQSTKAYTVHVYRPNEVATSIAVPTQCVHQALVDYRFSSGTMPRNVKISQGGNVIRSYRDTTGRIVDSLGAGNYTIEISSDKLACPSYYNLTVVDSGVYPNKPSLQAAYFCKFDEPNMLTAKGDSGAVIRWYTLNGGAIGGAPTPRTDTTGIFYWLADQKYKSCVSEKDTLQVYVTLRPTASYTGPDKICQNDTATFAFDGQIGVGPILEYHWNFDGAGYAGSTDSVGPWRVHWYDTGTKIVRLRVDENKCPSFVFVDTLIVKPVPYAGFDVADVCQFDSVLVRYNTTPNPVQTYQWYFNSSDLPSATGPGPYRISYKDSGTKQLALTVNLDGCSDTRNRTLYVYPVPDARILTQSEPKCIGDKVILKGDGGYTYYWTSSDSSMKSSEEQNYFFQILRPVSFKLNVSSDRGCKDSTAINYSTVQPCCNFAYPNAFTPNNDGRNDRFHVVTYGNHLEYELSIYNRWGQRVYYGTDAMEGWDGQLNGKPCDAGTYYYYLNAKCFTDHQETRKGELVLIR